MQNQLTDRCSDHSRQVGTASGINAALGLWLILSPWIFGYVVPSRDIAWNSIFAGMLVLIFGIVRYGHPHRFVRLSWCNVVLGTWTAMSPWMFGYLNEPGPLWNSVVVGFNVIAFAFWGALATATERHHQLA